eukprot:c27504_g2_i1 orf=347-3562(+)
MTTRKLVIDIVGARNLMPKDGQGSSSAYVQVDFDGQRKRTKIIVKDLNPVWDERLEFVVNDPKEMVDDQLVEVNVYNDSKRIGRRSNFLGRVSLVGTCFVKQGEEALIYYPLEKRGLFSLVKGDLGMKIYYLDEAAKPPETPTVQEMKQEAPPAESQQAPADSQPPPEEKPAEAPADGSPPPSEEPAPPPAEGAPDGGSPPPEETPPPPPPEESPPPTEEGNSTSIAEGQPNPDPVEEAPAQSADGPVPTEGAPPPDEPAPVSETFPADQVVRSAPSAAEMFFARTTPTVAHVEVKATIPAVRATGADYIPKDTNPSIGGTNGEKASTYDLVEKMQYLFVRVVKARHLAAKDITLSSDPYVRVTIGSHAARTRTISRSLNPEWNQVFAFGKDKLQASTLEISIWDEDIGKSDDFLGILYFDVAEIPTRVTPDSPLAPQWYRLEEMRGEGRVKGDIMLAVWMGTQADEAFAEAWQSDTGGLSLTRSKVYLSPKLWYLRVNVIEAQDLQPSETSRFPDASVKVQLGFQGQRTRVARKRTNSPFWNEDLLLVAAEPFEEPLILTVEDHHGSEKLELLGQAKISLNTVERRVDDRQVTTKWFNLQKNMDAAADNSDSRYQGRVHLRMCFDGGYHVMDEVTHLSSDLRPTAKQLWKPALGALELGVLGAQHLLPMKTKEGRGATDAYCVAKYGQKWVRTRTIIDSFSPRWNEQYTWEVYDPCTVLTLCVFDNCHLSPDLGGHEKATMGLRDARIGKVRIRLSTLESDRVYTNSFPLLVLQPAGVKKMGEIELAVRFSSFNLFNMMHSYSTPLLPKMHYLYPLGMQQQDVLRNAAMKIVALRLSRSEPPLRPEVVQYVLDSESSMWSMRRSKANWFRIATVLSGCTSLSKWMDDICHWRNPLTTVLVHILFVILICYPELILPTVFFYMFLIGLWQYRFRPRSPPYMDARISQAEVVDRDELDEEFDTVPTSKPPEIVMMRYERLRGLAYRIQMVLGDIATQGERVQSLLTWRDSRATVIFISICFFSAIALYVAPFRLIALLSGMYFLRHPRFREPLPSTILNFFRRLPAQSDRIL